MKTGSKIVFAGIFCFLISAGNGLAEDSKKDYRYGFVENRNSYPVHLRIIDSSGKERVTVLEKGKFVVLPIGTAGVEAYPTEKHPLTGAENLDLRVSTSGTGTSKKIGGFGDRLDFEQPTGGFPPSYFDPDYDATLMDGSCYADDRAALAYKQIAHKNPDVRAQGAAELGALKETGAGDALIKLASEDKDPEVLRSSVIALGEIGEKQAAAVLGKTLEGTNDRAMKFASADALGKIGTPEALDILRKSFTSSDVEKRAAAASGLGEGKNQADIGTLKEIALKDPDWNVRECAAVALGQIGGDDAYSALEEVMKRESDLAGLKAEEALRQAAPERMLAALRHNLKNGHETMKAEAARSLGLAKNGDEAEADLQAALKDPSANVRSAAAWALGHRKCEAAVDALEAALKDDSPYVRGNAAEALGKIGNERSRKALLETAKDSIPMVSSTAQDAIEALDAKAKASRDEAHRQAVASRDPRVTELNESLEADEERMKKIDPKGNEAKALGRKIARDRAELQGLIDGEREKEGAKWIDKYRDESGKLPGGYLEDDRSRLAKLNDARMKKKEEVAALEKKFNELKKKGDSRELGKTIKDLAGAKADLEQMDRDAACLEKKVGKTGSQEGVTGPAEGVNRFPDYDLRDYERKPEEPLTKDNYDLFKAIEEIGEMMKEVDFEREKHIKVFSSPRFLACYYLKRAGLPQTELGKTLWKTEPGTGRILDPFWEWMANDFAGWSDMWQRPVVPGITSNDGAALHNGNIKYRLKLSLDYLNEHSSGYENSPPLREMQHVRAMMEEWRRHVAGYHTDLDAFLEHMTRMMVLRVYHRDILYERGLKELEAKYASRDKDKTGVLQAKYDIELKQLNERRDKVDAELKKYMDGYDKVARRIDAWINAAFMEGLKGEFSAERELHAMNQEYMVKQARLKQVDDNGPEGKQLKEDMKILERRIKEGIEARKKKYGEAWMDAYRNPKTGNGPGGFLTEGPIAQFKAKNRLKSKGVSAAPKGQAPADRFYEFLKTCGR